MDNNNKIKVTYLDHSGFAVVTEKAILVFDYYRDPSHALVKLGKEHESMPVIFFVSHHHADHFNPEIFHLLQNHKRDYVISNDVDAMLIPDNLAVAGVSPGDTIEGLPGGIMVKAYGSTDRGVSFVVTLSSGEKIFHAGDLNYWHWNEESTVEEVKKAYNSFVKVMQALMEENKHFDIAFFPVDPRLGADYADGARLFLENIAVDNFFPMHFWGDYRAGCDFEDYTTDNTESYCLHVPGESVSLEGKMALRTH